MNEFYYNVTLFSWVFVLVVFALIGLINIYSQLKRAIREANERMCDWDEAYILTHENDDELLTVNSRLVAIEDELRFLNSLIKGEQ